MLCNRQISIEASWPEIPVGCLLVHINQYADKHLPNHDPYGIFAWWVADLCCDYKEILCCDELVIKAKMYTISSDTHQLQLIRLHHFKQERF